MHRIEPAVGHPLRTDISGSSPPTRPAGLRESRPLRRNATHRYASLRNIQVNPRFRTATPGCPIFATVSSSLRWAPLRRRPNCLPSPGHPPLTPPPAPERQRRALYQPKAYRGPQHENSSRWGGAPWVTPARAPGALKARPIESPPPPLIHRSSLSPIRPSVISTGP